MHFKEIICFYFNVYQNEEMLEEFYKVFDDVSENLKRIQQAQKVSFWINFLYVLIKKLLDIRKNY